MVAFEYANFEYAKIDWQNGHPYASTYQDVYFSTDAEQTQQGLAETDYVFLQHNQLQARWQALNPSEHTHFTIIETGFGSGLNFLATVDLWLATAPPSAQLHFISFEKHPFTHADLQKAHAHWPQLANISQSLLKQYQSLHSGFVEIPLIQHRVHLTLAIGDIHDCLPKLTARADAWFLDGFAPAKNPDMWQAWLFEVMVQHSKTNATFATFTSAGDVRRGLIEAGFSVKKATGYGKKREMLYGCLENSAPKLVSNNQPHIAIIGAGITGCATAYHLAKLGFKVSLFEQANQLADGASGNPRGVLYPRLTGQADKSDAFALHSIAYSLREYAQLAPDALNRCGVMQLAFSSREFSRLNKVLQCYGNEDNLIWLEAKQASAIANVSIQHPALFFKQCGWVSPPALCASYLEQIPSLAMHFGQTVQRMTLNNNGWQVTNQHGHSLLADAVVVASAHSALQLVQLAHLPLQAVRGQMSLIQADANSQTLSTVVCSDGYMIPANALLKGLKENLHAIGASFHPEDIATDLRDADHLANLNMASALSPDFKDWNQALTSKVLGGRAAIRCSSHDYLPLVGMLADAQQLGANLPKHASQAYTPPMHQALYVNLAHGSKGMSTAPFCAALLARQIALSFGIEVPMFSDANMHLALNPNRHLYKKLGLKRLLESEQAKIGYDI